MRIFKYIFFFFFKCLSTNCRIVKPHRKHSTTAHTYTSIFMYLFLLPTVVRSQAGPSPMLIFPFIPPSWDKGEDYATAGGAVCSLRSSVSDFGDDPSFITETGCCCCCCWVVSTEIINAEAKRLPPGNKLVYYDFSTRAMLILPGSGDKEFTGGDWWNNIHIKLTIIEKSRWEKSPPFMFGDVRSSLSSQRSDWSTRINS